MGFVVLTRGDDVTRRIPYWLRVVDPKLGREPPRHAERDRHLQGHDAPAGASLVTTYRYPDVARAAARPGPSRSSA